MTIIHPNFYLILSLGLLASPSILWAVEWQSCKASVNKPVIASLPENLQAEDTYLEADKALLSKVGESQLWGNVFIVNDGKQYFADKIIYNRNTEIAKAKGHVKSLTKHLYVSSKEATFNLKTQNNIATDASYQIFEDNGDLNSRGTSQSIHQLGDKFTYLNNTTYSTCPIDQTSWYLSSSTIKLNHEKEVGTARNVTLRVSKKNMPVFYFPYLSFPLTNERKSGFLLPSYTNSGKLGIGISIPYYFNLAPNYDYTLTPNFYSKRGIKYDNTLRYLTPKHNGVLNYEVLFNDNKRSAENRHYYNIRHLTQFSDRTKLSIDAEGASDVNYFDDFSDNLKASSRTIFERRIEAQTSGDHWNLMGRLQDFQLLDGTSDPYRRLPQIVFNYDPDISNNSTDLSVSSELVYFDKKKQTSATTGSRFDVNASVSKNFSSLSYFLKPSLRLRYTQYNLNNNPPGKNKITRTLPTFSVDSGIFFERDFANGKKVQTLEPRLFYTHTPYTDQDDIPIFDTSENSFRYDQLFSESRFSGKDRIEDTNRLSASLTSRILDQATGNELFTASVGQIFHFNNRNVTLPGNNSKTNPRSELALEFSGNLNENITVSSTSLWKADASHILSGQLRLNYQDDKSRSVNSTYRYRQDSLKQLDLDFSVPVKNNWRLTGGWNQDLLNQRTLENNLGIEYTTCCIRSRISAKKYLTSDNNTYDNAIFMEVSFKGLGSFTPIQ